MPDTIEPTTGESGSMVGACVQNASDLLSEAELLAREGRMARATALTILGGEEYIKAFVWRMVQAGLASFDIDPARAGAPMRVCKHLMSDHELRHKLISICLWGLEVLPVPPFSKTFPVKYDPEEIQQALNKGIPPEVQALIPEKIQAGELERFGAEVMGNRDLVEKAIALRSRFGQWNSLKNRALYVDLIRGAPVLPSSVGGAEYEDVKAALDVWYSVFKFIIQPVPPEALNLMGQFARKAMTLPSPAPALCSRCKKKWDARKAGPTRPP